MKNYNFETAYLTRKNGVIYLKQNGNAKDRIDKVSVLIDFQNILTIEYNYLHYRYNQTTESFMYPDYTDKPFKSTFKADEVLEDYLETFEHKSSKFVLFGKNKEVIVKQIAPKNGLVRLNKMPERIRIITTGYYDIEVSNEPLTGNIYTKNPII